MQISWQCDGKSGVCPDERIGGRNDAVLVSGERKNGVTTIVYRRPLQTNEPINDRAVPTDVEVSVIAAIGPLNNRKEANAHAIRDKTTGEFGSECECTLLQRGTRVLRGGWHMWHTEHVFRFSAWEQAENNKIIVLPVVL